MEKAFHKLALKEEIPVEVRLFAMPIMLRLTMALFRMRAIVCGLRFTIEKWKNVCEILFFRDLFSSVSRVT